jgi:hypothetical protein
MMHPGAPRSIWQGAARVLEYKTSKVAQINCKTMVPIVTGSLPKVKTRDHVNGIINKGAKIFLPKRIISNKYTPVKYEPIVQRMVEGRPQLKH